MKKILVTGGLGFIGSNLVNYLISKNYFIINIDKSGYSSNKKYFINSKNKNYIFFKIDIKNKSKLYKIVKKFRPVGIFNLAAETHVDRSIDNSKNFINSNILGVHNILEVLRKIKREKKINIRFVQVSTDEVYGDMPFQKSANENYNYNPSSPYSASKASADQIIKAYKRTYNLDTIIANACNNYGPCQFPEKFIPKIIYNLINNKPIEVYGNGKNIREWIYVKDNCEALLKVFLKGKTGENYNIGTGIRLKNIDIVNKIILLAKKKNILFGKRKRLIFVKDRPGHDRRYALVSTKIKKKIGWVYKTKLDKGLSETIDWYIKNKSFFKKIPKKEFTKRFGLQI
tara:strand:+ start:1766 stop:2794 length:1029 start_codon:yes stop_codon:yes gene_type:complete